jgi:hypothetical protein
MLFKSPFKKTNTEQEIMRIEEEPSDDFQNIKSRFEAGAGQGNSSAGYGCIIKTNVVASSSSGGGGGSSSSSRSMSGGGGGGSSSSSYSSSGGGGGGGKSYIEDTGSSYSSRSISGGGGGGGSKLYTIKFRLFLQLFLKNYKRR